jgi:hypothetical protein
MTKETAARVHQLLLDCSRALDTSIAVVQNESDESDLHAYRHAVGRVLMAVFDELMMPIYREHPDLIPPELDRRSLRL